MRGVQVSVWFTRTNSSNFVHSELATYQVCINILYTYIPWYIYIYLVIYIYMCVGVTMSEMFTTY